MNQSHPTYCASDIKKLCIELPVEYDTFKTITEIIEDELDLYSTEDLVILAEASIIMFTRCMLFAGIKYIR